MVTTTQHLVVIILRCASRWLPWLCYHGTMATPNRSNYQHLIVPTFSPATVRLGLAAVGWAEETISASDASITHSVVSLVLVTSFVSAVSSHKLRRAAAGARTMAVRPVKYLVGDTFVKNSHKLPTSNKCGGYSVLFKYDAKLGRSEWPCNVFTVY